MSPPPVPPPATAPAGGTALDKGKDSADRDFHQKKGAGAATQPCPPCKERWLKVAWTTAEVYCADMASMDGQAAGIESVVTGSGNVKVADSSVGQPSVDGQTKFPLKWQASGVDFTATPPAKSLPPKLPAVGELSADGMSATTPKALVVKRLPDKPHEKVTIACASPKSVNGTNDYAWTAAFELGVQDAALKVKQTLQIKKAWLGKWVSFDATKDKLKQTWGYVKKDGTDWKYWDTGDSGWKMLPRDVSAYTLTSIVFIDSGGSFKGRDDASQTWPEKFAEPSNYETMKTAWLKNITDTWGRVFMVKHAKCSGIGLCQWDLDVDVSWSTGPGDKLVWAIWAADWERSNASDWYLSETRLGVAGHECGHLLAAYDEYTGGAIHPGTKKIEPDSIMGQNLTSADPRHLEDMKKEVRKKIKAWIGRDWELEVKRR